MRNIGKLAFFLILGMVLSMSSLVLTISVAAQQPIIIKVAHIYPPESLYSKTTERLAKNIEAHTNGRVKFQIYGSASLGDWREVIEALQIGTNNSVIESVGTLDRYDPLPGIEAFPYMLRDVDHFNKLWFGPIGKDLHEDIMKKTKFRTIGAIYRGSRNLSCNRAVNTVEDLKGLKLRVPPLKMYRLTWEYLGASPVPMAFTEVFTALQQGTIDGQENPLNIIHDFKFNEVCKYLVMTKHVQGAMTYIFYDPWFQKLPKDVQEIVTRDIEEACQWGNTAQLKIEDELKANLVKRGMKLMEPDLGPFRAKLANLINEFPELKGYYDRIEAIK